MIEDIQLSLQEAGTKDLGVNIRMTVGSKYEPNCMYVSNSAITYEQWTESMTPTAWKSVMVALHTSGDANETNEDVTADKKKD